MRYLISVRASMRATELLSCKRAAIACSAVTGSSSPYPPSASVGMMPDSSLSPSVWPIRLRWQGGPSPSSLALPIARSSCGDDAAVQTISADFTRDRFPPSGAHAQPGKLQVPMTRKITDPKTAPCDSSTRRCTWNLRPPGFTSQSAARTKHPVPDEVEI